MVKKSGKSAYIPDQGDIIWINFDPQSGHEQAGHRLAIVVSPTIYNSTFALVCPITTKPKGYPFEVHLAKGMKTEGVILADQIKSIDWKARKAKFYEKSSTEILNQVVLKVQTLLPIVSKS